MTKITRLSQLDLNATYSYADYLTWQLDETVELIKGKIMLMSPAPNLKHQSIITNLGGALYTFFNKKPCKLFYAPFDVSLYDSQKSGKADQDIYSVVQPDLCVICDLEKLTEQGCSGAPDWIIEVLSKGDSKKEMRLKYELYQENGVTEYWLVYPYEQAIYQFVLTDKADKYQLLSMYAGDESAKSYVFPDLEIELTDVFAD